MNQILILVLTTTLLLALSACKSKDKNEPEGGNAKNEVVSLTSDEKTMILNQNGQATEELILAITSIAEARKAVEGKVRIKSLGEALDRAFEVDCRTTCEIKERETSK